MASGDTLAIFHPYNQEPPASNVATLATRNLHIILEFDGAVNESTVFSYIMPQHYGGGGVDVYIHWSHVGTTGDVDWDGAFERIGDGVQDVDSDNFATAESVDGTAVPATDGDVDIVAIPFTDGAQMSSVAVGEKFRLKITRDAVSDTSTAIAEIHAVEIRET